MISKIGSGAFIRKLKPLGSPADVVQLCKKYNLSWVAILDRWYDHNGLLPYNVKDMTPYADKLRSAGINVALWGYPDVDHAKTFVSKASSVIKAIQPFAYLLDLELPFHGNSGDELDDVLSATNRLVSGLLETHTSLGVVSYPVPTYHAFIPEVLMTAAKYPVSYWMPMLYAVSPGIKVSHFRRSLSKSNAKSYSWIITNSGNKGTIIPALASTTSITPSVLDRNWVYVKDSLGIPPGCVYWDLHGMRRHKLDVVLHKILTDINGAQA